MDQKLYDKGLGIRKAVLGEAYVSNATIHGKFALRACITNFRTTKRDIDQTLEIIRAAAGEIG